MISLTAILFTFVFGVVVYLLLNKDKNRGKKFPNGPWALPFLGNARELSKGHLQVVDWAKKYGDVVQIYIMGKRCYILSDYKMVREMSNDPLLSARPHNELFAVLRDGMHGVVAASGQEWMEQKRFTLRHLRDFGFGKSAGEELIMVEVKETLESFSKLVGKPSSLDRSFNVAILNTLWMITAGKRYPQDDPRLWAYFDATQDLAKKINENALLFLAPSIAKHFPKLFGWDRLEGIGAEIDRLATEHIKIHKETLPEDGTPRDFIDAYLMEISKTEDKNSSFYKDFGIKSLKAVIVDFFIAGSDTTTATLLWCVLYMCKFPEAQKNLQAEVDQIVGRNRHPCLADRPNLPYLEASIAETTRYSSIVPTNLQHCATADTKLGGYDIPKGTEIMSNLYGIHHDEKLFPEPEKFLPERFLSKDGKQFKRHEALLPFGSGKRACLGETLARDELFLYISSMFQKFNFSLAPESIHFPIEAKSGILLFPGEFKVIMTERE